MTRQYIPNKVTLNASDSLQLLKQLVQKESQVYHYKYLRGQGFKMLRHCIGMIMESGTTSEKEELLAIALYEMHLTGLFVQLLEAGCPVPKEVNSAWNPYSAIPATTSVGLYLISMIGFTDDDHVFTFNKKSNTKQAYMNALATYLKMGYTETNPTAWQFYLSAVEWNNWQSNALSGKKQAPRQWKAEVNLIHRITPFPTIEEINKQFPRLSKAVLNALATVVPKPSLVITSEQAVQSNIELV